MKDAGEYREKLPERREGEHFEFIFRGRRFQVGVGKYPDGRIAEVVRDVKGKLYQTDKLLPGQVRITHSKGGV